MPSLDLRPYQADGVRDIREEYQAGHQRVLYTLPTGGGKTHLFSYIAAGVVTKGKRVIVLVHRDELLRQCSASFASFGISHGIVARGVRGLPQAPALVASVFTLARRLEHVPPPDLIVCDEAHHATRSTTFGKTLAAFPEAKVLGVTATPCRLDGTGLGETFSAMVQGPTVAELTAAGYLCPAEIYGPPHPVDLSGVKTRAGDFAIDQVDHVMDTSTVTGDVVDHYRRLADGRAAVAFCCSVKHAYHVAEQFRAAGYSSVAVEGKTDIDERRQAIADLASGKLQVLTSAEIVSEGVDVPRIECAILLRPTQSTGLYLQQVGRSLRPYPGKESTIVLDHAGNYMRHGLPDQDRLWTLEGAKRSRGKTNAPAIRTCPECFAVHAPAPICPRCGHVYAVQSRVPEQVEGTLERVNGQPGKQMEMPDGYTMRPDGLYYQYHAPPDAPPYAAIRLSDPFEVVALPAGSAFQARPKALLRWRDPDDREHERLIRRSELFDGPGMRELLLDGGLFVTTDRQGRRALKSYCIHLSTHLAPAPLPIGTQIKRATSREALERLAQERGYRPGWVDHVLRSRREKRIARAMTKESW